MAPLNRRSFLAGFIAAPVLAMLAPVKVDALSVAPPEAFAQAETVDHTLTGRILQTLAHRKSHGLTNAAIYISADGHNQIQREHGIIEPDWLIDLSLRGVPCYQIRTLEADNYWVVAHHSRDAVGAHNTGWVGVMRAR